MGSFAVKGPKVFFSELSKSGRRSAFQVYQKHNRNLIGEDESPELVMALRRRLSLVQREPGGRRRARGGASGAAGAAPASAPAVPSSIRPCPVRSRTRRLSVASKPWPRVDRRASKEAFRPPFSVSRSSLISPETSMENLKSLTILPK